MPPKRPAASPKRSASPAAAKRAASPAAKRAASPAASKPAATKTVGARKASEAVAKRKAELDEARAKISTFTTPLTVLRLFGNASLDFLKTDGLAFATGREAICFYVLLGAYYGSKAAMPALYAPPTCGAAATAGGPLFVPELWVSDFVWWLVLGILSSIGFGTGLHSGIMFLWPFVLSIIGKAESCNSTRFAASYHHPCALDCSSEMHGDGSYSFFNTLLLLLPPVIMWGSGTAIGELPPYFITRAAKRAGTRASDFEDELNEASTKTDLVSRLKVMTIEFTEKHGFGGILLLASWPNAAFDMCGMACGWLEVPFWTFFGATLLGKGVIKVTLQSMAMIVLFGPALFKAFLAILPAPALPATACAKAGVAAGVSCTLPAFLEGGRDKAKLVFALQTRVLPKAMLGKSGALTKDELVAKYALAAGLTPSAKEPKYKAMLDKVEDVFLARDANGDAKLSLEELAAATSYSDGKLSLASLDPGKGGVFSVGNLWNVFILALCLFFVYSIIEQVALSAQVAADAAALDAFEASLKAAPPAKAKKSKKE